jgi:hypothetical protein
VASDESTIGMECVKEKNYNQKEAYLLPRYSPSGSIMQWIPTTVKQARRLAVDRMIESVVYAVGTHIV